MAYVVVHRLHFASFYDNIPIVYDQLPDRVVVIWLIIRPLHWYKIGTEISTVRTLPLLNRRLVVKRLLVPFHLPQ